VAMGALGAVTSGQTFTASGPTLTVGGGTLSAEVTFVVSNLDLVVTLSNTSLSDPANANDILTAFFFTLDGDLKLTPVSAEVPMGSSVVGHRLPLGFTGDVGSQWAYRNDLVGAPNGANEGISSETLKWFGTKNLLSSQKIKGFGSLGSIAFGLTTVDDSAINDQGSLKNQGLIQNSVVFTFSGLPEDFVLSDISNVTFQYGTSLKTQAEELMGQNVPEPSTIGLVVVGLLGGLAVTRRRLTR